MPKYPSHLNIVVSVYKVLMSPLLYSVPQRLFPLLRHIATLECLLYIVAAVVWALKHWNIIILWWVSSSWALSYVFMKPHLVGMLELLEPVVFPSLAHTCRRLIDLRGSPWIGCCHPSAGLLVSLSTEAAVLRVWVITCASVCVDVCACAQRLLSHIVYSYNLFQSLTSNRQLSIDRQLLQARGGFVSGFFLHKRIICKFSWVKQKVNRCVGGQTM